MSRVTFSPVTPNIKKLFADDYKTWWSKTHGNFLDNYFQILVDAAGPISTKISEGKSTSSHEDRCWKKVRSSNKSGDTNLVVLEIPDSVDSPSRTLTVPFKESLSEVKEEIEKLHKKEKDLEVLLEATEKEIEEVKLGVLTVEKDFDACNDADLLNDDDLTNLEQKRERLEAMHQDLINYKLCLD
ncbi:hypothetical protein HAX54_023609 [Datura stramonium]|uniref:Uncharacterized protein n=1 Tax=Datura stramonium TaxID=4076 RepID=A0ABS8UWU8_DATST|nr:hypothetical protein [Datura stramonium]